MPESNIGPTIRPQVMAEHQVFFEYRDQVELFQVWSGIQMVGPLKKEILYGFRTFKGGYSDHGLITRPKMSVIQTPKVFNFKSLIKFFIKWGSEIWTC